MSDLTLTLKLTADSSGYTGTVKVAADELEKLGDAGKKAGEGVGITTKEMTEAVAVGQELGKFVAETAKKMVEWAQETIHQTAELKDWSDTIGASVEQVSMLTNVARVGGLSQDYLRTATERLSVALASQDEEGKRASRALAALGISTKDPIDAMQQLADRLSLYRDGAEKVALVNDILGRGSAKLLPFLKDLADANHVGASRSTEQANAAQELERNWRTLQIQGGALADVLLNSVVPALNSVLESMNKGIQISGSFWGSVGLSTYAKPFESAISALERVKREIAEIEASDPLDAIMTGRSKEALPYLKQVEQYLTAIAKAKGQIFDNGSGWQAGSADHQAQKPSAPNLPGLPAKAGVDEFAKALQDANKQLAEAQLQMQAAFSDEPINAADKALAALMASEVYQNLTLAQQIELVAKLGEASDKLDLAKQMNDARRALASYDADLKKWAATYQASLDKQFKSIGDLADRWEAEADGIGKTADERELDAALTVLQKNAQEDLNRSLEDYQGQAAKLVQAFNDKRAAEARQKFAEDWQHTNDEIGASFADAMVSAFSDIRNAGKSLARWLLDTFSNLVLKPTIQAAFQPASQGLTSLIMGNAAPSAGGTGGLLGSFGSLFGGSVAADGFGPATAGLFEAGGALGAVGSFLPYLGVALAAASALGLFKKEPSQVKGTFGVSGGTGGFEDNAYTSTKFGNIGFVDSGTQQFSGDAAQTFNQTIASSLNAIATRLSPEQIARVSQQLQQTNFGTKEGEYTTEDFIKKYGADVLKKVISTAFDELNPAMAKLVQNFTGSADEITAYANSLLQLNDAISGDVVKDAATAYKAATQTAYDALVAQGDAVTQLASTYDGSADATAQLATQTALYRNQVVSLLVAYKQVADAIKTMFASTRESIATAGLSDTQLYSYYQKKADDLYAQLATEKDPAKIQQISSQINDYINKAFGLLSPEDQVKNKDTFLAHLDQVDKAINDRLTALGVSLATDSQSPLQAVSDAITKAADTNVAAANTQAAAAASSASSAAIINNAANTIAGAAGVLNQTLANIHITLSTGGSEVGG